jgi:hypothetical protein
MQQLTLTKVEFVARQEMVSGAIRPISNVAADMLRDRGHDHARPR